MYGFGEYVNRVVGVPTLAFGPVTVTAVLG